jgi:hypothetical protein
VAWACTDELETLGRILGLPLQFAASRSRAAEDGVLEIRPAKGTPAFMPPRRALVWATLAVADVDVLGPLLARVVVEHARTVILLAPDFSGPLGGTLFGLNAGRSERAYYAVHVHDAEGSQAARLGRVACPAPHDEWAEFRETIRRALDRAQRPLSIRVRACPWPGGSALIELYGPAPFRTEIVLPVGDWEHVIRTLTADAWEMGASARVRLVTAGDAFLDIERLQRQTTTH